MLTLKRKALLGAKNLPGLRTNRKVVVFSVDDYGNVRLDSKEARSNMDRDGLKTISRFDAFDSLETREDLEALFETLASVKDSNGNSAVFTPFAVPCNIDFELLHESNYQGYQYELLPETFSKLSAHKPTSYEGTWALWKEGIEKGFFCPQFHGREHLNIRVFEEKLRKNDKEIVSALKNRSYTSISSSGYPTIGYTSAYEFWDFKDNERFHENIKDGIRAFEKVFGIAPIHFCAPGGPEHHILHKTLMQEGVRAIDAPWVNKEHQGQGRYRYQVNRMGKTNKSGLKVLLRNVVFEPSDHRGFDWVEYALQQIQMAFLFKKPAIISSHRVNFCGHIDPENRKTGLASLKKLLAAIVKKWPEVEFVATRNLLSLDKNG